MVIQVILSLFIIFALSRVIIQLKSANLSKNSFIFWSILFILALVGVIEPELTTSLASFLGIGRGTDVILYVSIALIFYLIFRLSIAIEETRREIAEVVRKLAVGIITKTAKSKPRRKAS